MPPGPEFHDETKTMVREARGQAPLPVAIRIEGVPAQPPVLRLSEGSVRVGSAPDCDIVVNDRTVSRRHVDLALVPEGVVVRDLGSHNGTYYLDQRVEHIVLAPGGKLQVGSARLSIDLDSSVLAGQLPPHPHDRYAGMVGASLAMRRLFAMLERLEGSLVTVLVEGESGVGKELIALALHEGSSVAEGPYVTVNCGALASSLVASELFGHRRGAFTGAQDSRRGAFVAADGGTLFLDEIGELPLDVQPMLLRALESGEVRPVGSDEVHRVRVRVIAATNRDLRQEVAAGQFRSDLFYRLAVVRLAVPSLSKRPEDISTLANHFAHRLGIAPLPPPVLAELRGRGWPGNVRELRNTIEAYAALGVLPVETARQDTPLDEAVRPHVDLSRPYAEQKDALVERFTRLYLEALLERTGGNQTAAAEVAGIGRSYLNRLLQKHGIR